MSANQSANSPLSSHGLVLGQKCARPKEFKPVVVWSTKSYSFYIDLDQMIGRRISINDANPDLYFTVATVNKTKKLSHFRNSKLASRAVKGSLATVAAAAAFLLIYPFYPAAKYEVDRKVAQTISNSTVLASAPEKVSVSNRVIIPKIGVDTAIVEGKTLKILETVDGVWHETGVETGNIVLAGHRFKYLPPNTTTLYNLNKVVVGDTIVVDWYQKRYIYVVSETKVVDKTEIGIRNPTPTPTLTIYSCEEKNQANRIVVQAKLIN